MTAARSHSLAALVAVVAAAACTTGPPPIPSPERAAVELDAVDVRSIAQLLRFEDRREFDPGAFEELAAGSVEVRRRAALAAGRIGDAAAVPLLARMLVDDPNAGVRADAAFALGELGDTSRAVLAALRETVRSGWTPVRGDEATVMVEVVHALGKLGTFEARGMVVDALRAAHPGKSPTARRVAAEGLLTVWRFSEGPGRVNAAVRYLDSPDPELRWRATYALMRLDRPGETASYLLERLNDDDHRVRANAARGLGAAAADSAGLRDTVAVALARALGDDHPHVRINAVRSLAGYGDHAPVDQMITLLSDANPHVAMAAAGAVARHVERAGPALAAVMRDAQRPYALRAAAAQPLADDDPAAVLTQLESWAGGEFTARYAAARTVDAVGWERGRQLVRRLTADRDLRVAVAGVAAASQLAADTALDERSRDQIRGLLMELAETDRRRVGVAAVRGLEPLVDSMAMDALRRRHGVADEETRVEDRTPAFYREIVERYVAPTLAGEPGPGAVIRTARGTIVLELLAADAPLTVHNFVSLARARYWDDGVWHRVVPNFVLQDGAPAGDPNGGPGWRIRDEINRVRYARGVLGMALAGPDTGGSQWFITHSPQHHLDGGYTVFGRVVDGMDVADRVLQGDPIASIRAPQ